MCDVYNPHRMARQLEAGVIAHWGLMIQGVCCTPKVQSQGTSKRTPLHQPHCLHCVCVCVCVCVLRLLCACVCARAVLFTKRARVCVSCSAGCMCVLLAIKGGLNVQKLQHSFTLLFGVVCLPPQPVWRT